MLFRVYAGVFFSDAQEPKFACKDFFDEVWWGHCGTCAEKQAGSAYLCDSQGHMFGSTQHLCDMAVLCFGHTVEKSSHDPHMAPCLLFFFASSRRGQSVWVRIVRTESRHHNILQLSTDCRLCTLQTVVIFSGKQPWHCSWDPLLYPSLDSDTQTPLQPAMGCGSSSAKPCSQEGLGVEAWKM